LEFVAFITWKQSGKSLITSGHGLRQLLGRAGGMPSVFTLTEAKMAILMHKGFERQNDCIADSVSKYLRKLSDQKRLTYSGSASLVDPASFQAR
jgi:hypothetical protein